MNEEVVLELASQKVIQFLLSKQQFIEQWQEEVSKNLEKQKKYEDDEGVDLRKPSTSTTTSSAPNKPTDSSVTLIQSIVLELNSTVRYFIEIFEDNVDPRNCYLSDRRTTNKTINFIYDAGQKVDRLKNLAMDKKELRKTNGERITAACRLVNTELKRFSKHFQGSPSLEIQSILPLINRFCRQIYTISHEISRFSEGFHSTNRKLLKNIASTVEESANEFNLKVTAEIEKIIKSLESSQKRQQSRPSSAPKPATPLLDAPAYGIQTRHQQRLASSIQQVMGCRTRGNEVEFGNKKFQKTHPAGGIATSIIPLRKGFLMEDNLMKARQRIASTRNMKPRNAENLNIDKSTPLDESEDLVLKSARKLTGLVLDDVRKSIKF
ncbi:unnamed protein product [Caenorhabditis brenneri]